MPTISTLAELRSALADRAGKVAHADIVSSGIPALDRLLPHGGWRAGSLMEWLAETGSGVTDLAFRSLLPRLSETTWCVVDPAATFCALPQVGRASARCLIVRPPPQSLWWAVEQVLRCPGIAVTWCHVDAVPERVLRRWQLAVEAGGGIGMLFRPISAARQRSWSDLRLSVTPVVRPSRMSRAVRVEVVSCHGRLGCQAVVLELHHAPDSLSLVSELDDSALVPQRPRFALRFAGRVG